MKALTKKQKQEMKELSDNNNSLRFHNFAGVEFELIGTKRNSNNTWSITLRNNSTRVVKTMGWNDYQKLIRKYENLQKLQK